MSILKKLARFAASATLLSAVVLTTAMASEPPTAVVTADALRLRAEPSLTAPIVAIVNQGSEVSVLSEELNGWHEVLYRDQQGFMDSSYLAFQEESDLLAYVDTGGSALNLRSGPGTTYEIVDKAPGGSVLNVVNSGEGWYEISREESTAFVSGEHIRLMTPEEYETFKNSAAARGQELAIFAQDYIGCRYVYGGNGPSSFDCSGFVKYVYAQFGHSLNRTATDQLDNGVSVEKAELIPGDLVFFNNGYTAKPVSHVGLYIGEGEFVHASTETKGVRIDNLDSGHYADVYVYARRIF